MDHKNENFNMFDLIAYRIKFTPHPHAGSAWWGPLQRLFFPHPLYSSLPAYKMVCHCIVHTLGYYWRTMSPGQLSCLAA